MKIPSVAGLLCGLLIVQAPLALAEKADRDKPINVEADALRYDDARQLSVFSGHVVLTKGTLLIRGATIELRQDPQGYPFGVVKAEPGKLAFFRQKREGLDEYIEGEAETIDYDGRADVVKFSTRAKLRRYQGERLNDEFNAGVIVYNNLTEVFSLDGAPPGSTSSASGRVRATLTPKKADAPAAPVPLRPTPQLRGATP